MKRLLSLSILACGLCVTAMPPSEGQAQVVTIGRGGVQYNAYGRGYYGGGYGAGYGGVYGPSARVYSGYGNGPYGYGSGYGGYNGYGNSYNGYGGQRYYAQPRPIYRPYGFGIINNYGYGW